jgi:CheY-like chemotaxis protein
MMFADESPSSAESRILVIEDEYLVAEDISMTLEELGYRVVGPVPSVDEAIALIVGGQLDGALLDANLDGISSAPVAAALATRGVPFVVVTGYGRLDLPTSHLNAAPRITKPFSSVELGRTLAQVLQG